MRNIFALTTFTLFCFLLFGQKMKCLVASLCIGAEAKLPTRNNHDITCAVSRLQNFWQEESRLLWSRNNKELRALGNETVQTSKGGSQITIASSGEQGVLYGTYHLLRLPATGPLPESSTSSISPNDLIINSYPESLG